MCFLAARTIYVLLEDQGLMESVASKKIENRYYTTVKNSEWSFQDQAFEWNP